MTRRRKVPYVRNALFRGIPDDVLDVKELVRSRRTYDAGRIVFDEGDAPDYCYLVASGSVRITKALPDGHQELLATIEPGDFFGELALYDSNSRSARATAAEPTRLGLVDLESFNHLRQIAPFQMASTLAECSIERVRQTNLLLVAELGIAGRLSKVGHELSTVSHNLRGPLSTIRNAADLLQEWLSEETRDPEQVGRFVDIIRRTADTGLAQIEHLMARVRGEIAEDRVVVSTDLLLRELRELTAGFLQNQGIRYRDDRVSYRGSVRVDTGEFLSVLCNLVKNAAEALPEGGGEIDVAVAEKRGVVVFSVSDTGTGIPPEHRARVFERGFTSGKSGGTGLGLAHARAVVESHGGRIFVEEGDLGRGTTIRIHLPPAPGR